MSVKLYLATSWQDEIVEKEFERVTEDFAVDARGRRRKLRSGYKNFFESRAEAVAWKVDFYTQRRDAALKEYVRTQSELDAYKRLEGL